MTKMRNRVAAAFLVLTMVFSFVPTSVYAAAAEDVQGGGSAPEVQVSNDEPEITGTNSFGELIANELSEYETNHDSSSKAYAISRVEMNGKTATVEYSALKDCQLVVAIYTDDGIKMLGSGTENVSFEDKTATVTIDIAVMPQYFLIKAFMMNSDHSPLSDVFTDELYTEAIQQIKQQTMDDFSGRDILNLDNDKTTNFAVYKAGVIVIKASSTANVYNKAASNENTGVYVFDNADSKLTSAVKGKIVAYEVGDDVLIFKVLSVNKVQNADGTVNVTFKGDANVETKDVFELIKMENGENSAQSEPDYSDMSEYVTVYDEGLNASDLNVEFSLINNDFGIEIPKDKDKDKDDDNKFKCEGEFKAKLHAEVTAKFYFYLWFDDIYVDVGFDYEFKGSISVSGELGYSDISLGTYTIEKFGIKLIIKPKVEFSISAEIEFGVTLSGHVGFGVDKNGFSNKSTIPKVDVGVKFEGTIFLGFNLNPEVEFINKKIAIISCEGKLGFEIKGTMDTLNLSTDNSAKHLCNACIDGDVNIVFGISAWAKLLNNDKWSYCRDIVPRATIKLFDWYYSITFNEFRLFQSCPHYEYRTKVQVCDSKRKNIEGASIYRYDVYVDDKGDNLSNPPVLLGTTDEKGVLITYLPDGDNIVEAKKGEKSAGDRLKIEKDTCEAHIYLPPEDEEMYEGEPLDIGVNSGVCGKALAWQLYHNGTLLISGEGDMSDKNVLIPIIPHFDSIKKVLIGKKVTGIGSYMFSGSNNTGICKKNR